MIDIGVTAQERGPFWIDNPGDLRAGIRVFNERDRRQSVNDVAERAWLDDQDGFQISDFKLQIAGSQSSIALFQI